MMYTYAVAEKPVSSVLRLPPDLHLALQQWARDEERSLNAQIVYLLRRAVAARSDSSR